MRKPAVLRKREHPVVPPAERLRRLLEQAEAVVQAQREPAREHLRARLGAQHLARATAPGSWTSRSSGAMLKSPSDRELADGGRSSSREVGGRGRAPVELVAILVRADRLAVRHVDARRCARRRPSPRSRASARRRSRAAPVATSSTGRRRRARGARRRCRCFWPMKCARSRRRRARARGNFASSSLVSCRHTTSGPVAASQPSRRGSRTLSELTFQVASFTASRCSGRLQARSADAMRTRGARRGCAAGAAVRAPRRG